MKNETKQKNYCNMKNLTENFIVYALRMSIDLIKENRFTLKKKKKKKKKKEMARSRRYLAETIKDTDYADDQALLKNISP